MSENSKASGIASSSLETHAADLQRERAQKIGAFFKNRRELAKVSLATAAADLGLESPSLLNAYENGTTHMPLEEIFALSNMLNIPPEEVLGLIYDLTFGKPTNF